MVKDIRDGGLKIIEFECLNGVLKINWLKSWIMHCNSFWYCIPNHLFEKIGGLRLLITNRYCCISINYGCVEVHHHERYEMRVFLQ